MAIKNNNSAKGNVKDIAYYQKKFWKIFFIGLGTLALFFLFASWGIFGSMPSFEDLENPDSNLATEIISADGVVIGKYFQKNRSQLKYSDLPKNLVQALVATEDARFYEHSGIDARGTLRAISSLGTSGGASTLSQQLAKQLFHGEGSKFLPFRIVQKVKEWIIAIRLERQYTKNEIIAMYCNVYDFGNNSVGVSSAAKTYFSKEPKDLTIDESAILVGMLSIWVIKRFNIKTISGEKVAFENKTFNKGQVYGGLIFGIGWAITGACPGPLFAQIGSGFLAVGITLLSAIAGTWVYGYFRDRLPH